MIGVIDNYDFKEMEPMRYWSPPASWDYEKKKTTTQQRIFSGDWWAAEKKDGYFAKFVKDEDGNMMLLSRSRNVKGEFPNKIEWVPHLHKFFEDLPNGTCLLGELYLPDKPGSNHITSLLGCLKDKCIARQEKEGKLHFYVFDILADAQTSLINVPAEKRFDFLNIYWRAWPFEPYVEYAKYANGKELWNMLQTVLANGGEGIVMTRGGALYQPGKRPSKDCQKVKKELQDTVDCFFTGHASAPTKLYTGKSIETWIYWENEITGEKLNGEYYKDYAAGMAIIPVTKPYFNGWAGSLEIGVLNSERIEPIGYISGLTDEIKANWKDYKGRCIEVAAMERHQETGGLRHAKFIRFRDDLTIKDCTLEKFNEQT